MSRSRNHAQNVRNYRARRRALVEISDPSVPHGTDDGYRNWGCRCDACRSAGTDSIRENFSKMAKAAAERNRRRIPDASNRGKLWTSAELEYVTARDADGNYLHKETEAAHALGRTYLAVSTMRHKCRHDPKYVALLGAPS